MKNVKTTIDTLIEYKRTFIDPFQTDTIAEDKKAFERVIQILKSHQDIPGEGISDKEDLGDFIPLPVWAKNHHMNPDNARQKALRKCFKTAVKIDHRWMIREKEEYKDYRYDDM